MEKLEQIDQQIRALEEELSEVKGRETEVYTRIVGYYRAVKNWNKGKREEYNHRICFTSLEHTGREPVLSAETEDKSAKVIEFSGKERDEVAGFTYFYRKTCPNCPAVRNYIEKLESTGEYIDVDSPEGMTAAGENDIFSVPTVVFRNSIGKEVFRAKSVQEIKEMLPSSMFCAV